MAGSSFAGRCPAAQGWIDPVTQDKAPATLRCAVFKVKVNLCQGCWRTGAAARNAEPSEPDTDVVYTNSHTHIRTVNAVLRHLYMDFIVSTSKIIGYHTTPWILIGPATFFYDRDNDWWVKSVYYILDDSVSALVILYYLYWLIF